MSQEALFGELRSILHRPASVNTWTALCRHLKRWPPNALENTAVPYALDIVERWPPKIRRFAPARWVDRPTATLSPALRLANILFISARNEALSAALLEALASSPNLSGLRVLEVHEELPPQGAQLLANTPHLARLTTLKLSCVGLDGEGMEALAASPHLKNLTMLDLSYNPLGERGMVALAGWAGLANLVELVACGVLRSSKRSSEDNEHAWALARSPYLGNLRSLDVSAALNSLQASAVMEALSSAPWCGSLRALNISSFTMNEASLRTLTAFTDLTSLSIEQCWIYDYYINDLIHATRHIRLTTLNLSHNELGDVGAQALANTPHFASLTNLNLNANKLSDGEGALGALAIAESPYLRESIRAQWRTR